MKRIMMMTVMMLMMVTGSVLAAGGESTSSSSDLRRLLYEQKALGEVENIQVDMYNQDNTWRVSGSAGFTDGEVSLQMDISAGPGYYRGSASWNDKGGNSLFRSCDYKLVVFKSGINMKDFPVYLCQYRNIQLKIEGPSTSDDVWVNGNRAWFSNGYWHVQIDEPWNIDELNIVWTGHGGWKVAVNPEYPFGDAIVITADGMDPTQDSASQMAAISFSGEDSWIYDVAGYMGIVGDTDGNVAARLATSIPEGTKVIVFFSYYDQNLGTVEYYNTAVKVTDVLVDGTVILVPLIGVGFDENQTQIRIVWQDADGKWWQSWVSMPGDGGKGG
jgi:hypothetical protein